METGKKWRIAVQENHELRTNNKELENLIKLKNEEIERQANELTVLKERWTKLQSGSLVYTNDSQGYADNLILLPNDFKTTYPQVIPKGFNTALYHKNRFIKIDNGVVIIDEEQYKKYIGGL